MPGERSALLKANSVSLAARSNVLSPLSFSSPVDRPGGEYIWPDGMSMTYELDDKFIKFLGPGSNPAGWEVSSLLYRSEEDLPFSRIILHAQRTSHSFLCNLTDGADEDHGTPARRERRQSDGRWLKRTEETHYSSLRALRQAHQPCFTLSRPPLRRQPR